MGLSIDREKVVKGLEICYCPPSKCEGCPYHDLPDEQSCNDVLGSDALALLKEQEAKSPVEREKNGYWNYICPTCGSRDEELFREWNYCPFCGQAVNWE